jgi:hypothetical protein
MGGRAFTIRTDTVVLAGYSPNMQVFLKGRSGFTMREGQVTDAICKGTRREAGEIGLGDAAIPI